MKKIPYKMVQVIWRDSHSSSSWADLQEVIADKETMDCLSIGFLVAEHDDRITLMGSMSLQNPEHVGDHLSIPRETIKEIIELGRKTVRPKKKVQEQI